MSLYPGDLLDNRYRIGAHIAHGGMSTVYTAVDTRLDREVAVKVMSPELAQQQSFRSRFEREARAVAKLNHPALVNVFDQGIDGTTVFLVMELVIGGSLRELLRERGPMPPHAAVAVMAPVLTALSIAHATGMVHRDIKPDNVLISDSNQVKLADFGLVRAIASTNTATDILGAGSSAGTLVIGTVGYLSPEQVQGLSLQPQSDVYSAGILLFELLTGTTPFREDTIEATARARLHQQVPAASSFIDGVPTEIDALIATATHRDPQMRFSNGADFLAALNSTAQLLHLPEFYVPAPMNSAVRRALTSADFGQRRPWNDEAMSTRAVDLHQPAPRPTMTLLPHQPASESAPPHSAPSPAPRLPMREPLPRRPLSNRSPATTIVWIALLIFAVSGVAIASWWLTSGNYGQLPSII